MRRTSEISRLALVFSLGLGACATSDVAVNETISPAVPRPAVRQGVVSVILHSQDPDHASPWAKKRPTRSRINGLVVTGRRILVHGRRLANSTLVMVQKLGASKRYEAQIVEVDYELPLGLLEVQDPEFWEGLEPLPIADDVPSEGDVSICRWLDSGQFEEARAVVKQLRVKNHFPGNLDLLTLELSSSISASGWGEIVVAKGEVVGITTSSSDDLLPALAAPVLEQFLDAVEAGTYRGFARHGFAWQRLSNGALRSKLGLQSKDGGIRIRKVLPHGSVAGAMEVGDVLLELSGHKIDERGKFDHPEYGRISFGVLFTDGVSPGDKLTAKVLRDGKPVDLQLTLQRMATEQDVVPRYSFDQAPEYLQVGGLVFQPLTVDYLRRWRNWWQSGPLHMLVTMSRRQSQGQDGERIIFLNRVLPDPVNLGYHNLRMLIVDKVNGVSIQTMDDVRNALKAPQDGFHIVEMQPGQPAVRVVVDAAQAKAADTRIRQRYGLPLEAAK